MFQLGVHFSACLVSRGAGERLDVVSSNQAAATKLSSISITSANLQPSEFVSQWVFENVASKNSTYISHGTGMSIVRGCDLFVQRRAMRGNHFLHADFAGLIPPWKLVS
jgi:hypothetical protein